MFKVIIVSLVCLFVGLFVFQQIDPNLPQNSVASVSSITTKDNKVSVTIEGEVVLPGIYKMEVNDTLLDLITASGGLLESADKDALNLNIEIKSRDYFYVPSQSIYQNECEITTVKEKININVATASQLATLSYISISLGEKIVKYREENGDFEAIEDVMKVTGIGRATYERIRDYITLK